MSERTVVQPGDGAQSGNRDHALARQAKHVIVGRPSVGEARERVRAALTAMGLSLPSRRVIINLAPADLLKEGSHFDLPMALAVLAAMDVVSREDVAGFAALGELSLDGTLNPVAGILPAAIGASADDLGLICPAAQGGEAAWAGRIEVLAPADLLGLINHFRGNQVLSPPEPAIGAAAATGPDLAEVKGMETAKRALRSPRRRTTSRYGLLYPSRCYKPIHAQGLQLRPVLIAGASQRRQPSAAG